MVRTVTPSRSRMNRSSRGSSASTRSSSCTRTATSASPRSPVRKTKPFSSYSDFTGADYRSWKDSDVGPYLPWGDAGHNVSDERRDREGSNSGKPYVSVAERAALSRTPEQGKESVDRRHRCGAGRGRRRRDRRCGERWWGNGTN